MPTIPVDERNRLIELLAVGCKNALMSDTEEVFDDEDSQVAYHKVYVPAHRTPSTQLFFDNIDKYSLNERSKSGNYGTSHIQKRRARRVAQGSAPMKEWPPAMAAMFEEFNAITKRLVVTLGWPDR